MKQKLALFGLVIIFCVFWLGRNKESNYQYESLSMENFPELPDPFIELWQTLHVHDETGLFASDDILNQGYQNFLSAKYNSNNRFTYNWYNNGPDNFGGRMRALCINSMNESHIYCGSVSGGLFETFDAGENWQVVEDWNASMFVSAIAQTNDGTIFIGTGNHQSEAFDFGGKGVYYKNPNDPNSAWQLVPGTLTWNINELAASGLDNKIYFGTTQNGLRMWDKDIGGDTELLGSWSINNCHEVAISGDGQLLLVRMGTNYSSGVYRSTDAGVTFNDLVGYEANGLFGSPIPIRFEFAISPEKVNNEYICYASATNSSTGKYYRSEDSGATWTFIGGGDFAYGQHPIGIWASSNVVDPTNYDRLLIGARDLFQWTANPSSPNLAWEQLSLWFLNFENSLYVHADIHQLKYDSQNRLYIANDGGVFVSEDNANTFSAKNRDLSTMHFYSVAASGSGHLVGGTQDCGAYYNNLMNPSPKSFRKVLAGDSFDAAISFFNPNVYFVSHWHNAIHRWNPAINNLEPMYPNFGPGYQTVGELISFNDYHMRTLLSLGELYDLNSEDSVLFTATQFLPAGSTVEIESAATGNVITHTLDQNLPAGNSVQIMDPYQSIFLVHTRKNGGEIWATKDALRLGTTPNWIKIAENVGNMNTGEFAFGAGLEHIYVGTNSGLYRIDGLNAIYSSNPNYNILCDLNFGGAPAISVTQLFSGPISGIGVNPNDGGDVVLTIGNIGVSGKVWRSNSANTAQDTGTFFDISSNLPTLIGYFDALIDVSDQNKLLVCSTFGVWSSDDGGNSWEYNSEGIGEFPVYRAIQNWRINHPYCTRPGEIYLATFGRSLLSDHNYLNIPNPEATFDSKKIMVFPNPASDYVNIDFHVSSKESITVEFYNTSGKLVLSKNLIAEQGQNTLNVPIQDLNKGMYLIRIKASDFYQNTKFLKH